MNTTIAEAPAFEDTHAALNDLLGFVLHAWPEVRRYLIYDRCLLRLALNRDFIEDAPLSGNFYEEAEALRAVYHHAERTACTPDAMDGNR